MAFVNNIDDAGEAAIASIGTGCRPETFNFATEVVDRWAREHPKREAMYWVSQDMSESHSLTFSHFSSQSHRIAIMLRQLGVQRGDVMIMKLPRVPAWWEVAVAGIRSGTIISPAPMLLSEKDIQYRCSKTKAKVFIGDETSVRRFEKIRSQCPTVKLVLQVDGIPSDNVLSLYEELRKIPHKALYESISSPWNAPALIYFTSGTSGPPKMVLHNQVSYPLALAATGKHWMQLRPGKLFWNMAEQGWGKAAWSFFGAWNNGASLFIYDDRGAFSARRTLDLLHSFPITTLCAPPLAWRQLSLRESREYYQSHPPLKLSHCTSAGEALSDEAIVQWKKLSGLDIHDGYGQTETTMVCGNFGTFPIRPGSMGKPAPSIPLFVIDSTGQECAEGEEGSIAIRVGQGEGMDVGFFGLFDGYIKDDGSLDQRLISYSRNGSTETWFLTGDRAKRDEDGYFWFVGRADDLINSSGYRIGPFEVESTLEQHPAVAQVAVVSSPDSARGEVVKAFVVLSSKTYLATDQKALVKELQDFCKANAAPYKYPRKIQFVDAEFFPKTASGKIQRSLLRKEEWRQNSAKI